MNDGVTINADQVKAYLQQHPDFFQSNLDLLENLMIPHPSGQAVSLISKQLDMFREKHRVMDQQLSQLVEVAKLNDITLNRMHELTLALMEAKTIEKVVSNLDRVFIDCFLADFTAVRIIRKHVAPSMNTLFIADDDDNLKHFDKELRQGLPRCGQLSAGQARYLFADQTLEVKSCTIIPMLFKELEGFIVLGSRNEDRFHHDMGHLFLTQISEVVGTRLMTLLA